MSLSLVVLALVLAALLGLVVVSWVVGRLPIWVWFGGLGSLDAVIWWLVALLWIRQRHDRRDQERSSS